MPAESTSTHPVYLVVGGDGFLGRHMVRKLLEREPNAKVRIFDRQASVPDLKTHARVQYSIGDLRSPTDILEAMQNVSCTIHSAAVIFGKDPKAMWAINVQGTQNVLDACRSAGCTRLVYTSSASVTLDLQVGNVLADETTPYPAIPLDAYNDTKAEAEKLVLEANDPGSFHTVVIRPSGIFGPEDATMMRQALRVVKEGKTGVQIGRNTSLADFTYVDNVVHGHLLAADHIEEDGVHGEIFIITNNEPILFWDMMRTCWKEAGANPVYPPKHLPYTLALGIAHLLGVISTLISPLLTWEPALTPFKVRILTTHRFFNIHKAKERLGYEPQVGLTEGIRRSVAWYNEHPEAL